MTITNLDSYDVGILHALQRNGRASGKSNRLPPCDTILPPTGIYPQISFRAK